MKMKLNLKLGQKLIITPQLQQAIKLLQLSRLELNQVISQELVENPMLEEEMTSESPESSEESLSSPSTVDESDETGREDKAEIEDLSFIWNEYLDDDRTSYSSAATEDLPSYEQ
ncbi:MAG: RNA polymerase sigma-54 factor, partial [Nitrospirota bacterium]